MQRAPVHPAPPTTPAAPAGGTLSCRHGAPTGRVPGSRRATAARSLCLLAAALLATACTGKVQVFSPATTIALPGGGGGMTLGHMAYSDQLKRFIVPGGQTGDVYFINPASNKVTAVAHVARRGDAGVTAVAYGLGYLFAGDRSGKRLAVVDAGSHKVVATRVLASPPDEVRYVASQKEVWVTEPEAAQIEVFRVHPTNRPLLSKRTTIAVAGGPESLVIDDQRAMAYTNVTGDKTVAIDLLQERIVGRWPNSCKTSRGLALAAARGLVFVGCREGKVVSLDVAHDGTPIASTGVGRGVDDIAYDAVDNLLYVPAADDGMLTLLSIAPSGHLHVLAEYHTARGAHCVVADESGRAYVCDPRHGQLLVIRRAPRPAGG